MKGGMHFYRGSGTGAARYFDEGHRGAESYYSEDARTAVAIDTWRDGVRVGSTTLAAPGDLIKWVEGVDPATGEVKGRIRSSGTDRAPLRFVEVVVNNPKSLSIVASQNPVVADAVDRVLARQADEIAAYMSTVAVTRIGPRGAQRDVGGLSVQTARVAHLTSREGDPHRHIHLMLNTRVATPDGSWHGLHSAAIRQHIAAVHERAARVLATDLDLRMTLASQGYSLGPDSEIDQARGAVKLMSKRSALVATNRARNEETWRAAHPGREPSRRVSAGWDAAGWEQGRKAKGTEHESPEAMGMRVGAELTAAGFDFSPGAYLPIEASGLTVAEIDPGVVAADAVAVLSSQRSAWTEAELTAGVEAAITRTGVIGEGALVAELVRSARAQARKVCLSVLDPELHTPTSMSRHLTSEAVVAADMRLNLGLAGMAGGTTTRDVESAAVARAAGLDAGQAEAVAAVCGSSHLEVVIGPAGAGKTRMLAVAKTQLVAQGREMVIVAPTRKAALVAGAEVGTSGASLASLVFAHGFRWDEAGRWKRLAVGETDTMGRTYKGPGPAALSPASVVVVDEAALTTVDAANALIDVCVESGASLRLVGDPRQLGAVGRGGVMESAARWSAAPVLLDEVHRFLRVGDDDTGMPVTEPDVDYAELSLAMRDGTDPDAVAARLTERGAVVVHTSAAEAVAAIAAEVVTQADRDGALAVTVATNEAALALNVAVRELRVQSGVVDDAKIALGTDGVRIGAGDRIVTRRNDTAADVANRETWTVDKITNDAGVLAHCGDRHVRLEAGYLAEAVQLAYATTDYGNQGVTTDASITWVGDATTAAGLYVGATRGRYTNAIHVVADQWGDRDDATEVIVAALSRDRTDRGLDAARSVAEVQAVEASRPTPIELAARLDVGPPPTSASPPEPPELTWAPPGTWRSQSELDAAAAEIEANLRAALRYAQAVPVMDDAAWEQANAADNAAAVTERERARVHQAMAASVSALREEIVAKATDDFRLARDAARTIAAGPGRFGRKAERVAQANASLAEITQRWGKPRLLPGPSDSDQALGRSARTAANDVIRRDANDHVASARRAEQAAAEHDRAVFVRNAAQRSAREANARKAIERAKAHERAEVGRGALEAERRIRGARVAIMTPEAVTAADQARNASLAEEAQRELAAAHERARIHTQHLSPGMQPHDRGPSIGM